MLAFSLVLLQAMSYLDAGTSMKTGLLIPLILAAVLILRRQPRSVWVGLAGLVGGFVVTWLVTVITGSLP